MTDSKNNPLLKILLQDLEKDTRTLHAQIKAKPIIWSEVQETLKHVISCSRLSKANLVSDIGAVLAELAHLLANEKESEKHSNAMEAFLNGLRLLEEFHTKKEETVEWAVRVSEWHKQARSISNANVPADKSTTEVPIPEIRDPQSEKTKLQNPAAGVQETLYSLFSHELDVRVAELNKALLKLETEKEDVPSLQAAMRAAHSIKGAARVVNIDKLVKLAHLIEEFFDSALHHRLKLADEDLELLFHSIDLLEQITKTVPSEIPVYLQGHKQTYETICSDLSIRLHETTGFKIEEAPSDKEESEAAVTSHLPSFLSPRMLRVNAETINKLMGLAGEALVETRWLAPYINTLLKLKREQGSKAELVDKLRTSFTVVKDKESYDDILNELLHKINTIQQEFSLRLAELEMFSRRYSNIAERLYHEVIESRMRPFSDVTAGLPRMVRDLAKQLHKKVRLEIRGQNTPVDREILEKMEAPLIHLIRNAVDHGIEEPKIRKKNGKEEEGTIILTAQHRSGMLSIDVMDDGMGIDPEELKQTILKKNLANRNLIQNLSLQELYDFVFLPGFTTATAVTEISGRGVGLSSVQTFVHEIGGRLKLESERGKGFHIHMLLPLTLSVIRALLIQIAGEPYALPLSKIDRVLFIDKSKLSYVEQRPYFEFQGHNIGLISASEVLELEGEEASGDSLPVVLISDQQSYYGIVVEKFIGEKELVVQELDPLLGKVPNINAGAFMEDGSPILILDIEDLLRTIDMSLSGGRLRSLRSSTEVEKARKKRILVVDDSITVREVECRLLENQGYEVESAVNGMDGWNALRTAHYDLIVTDVDMPRMDGIALVRAIRSEPRFKDLPILIVSYKEREEDRMKGLEAGANYYLTKSSFHDETLVKAVRDLIGEPITEEGTYENRIG